MAPTWRRRRRSHERQNSASVGVAASLADGGQVAEQGGDVLEVLDGEAQRLVALQEAIEDSAAHQPDVRPAALRGDPAVQVVAGGQRARARRAVREIDSARLVEKLARAGDPSKADARRPRRFTAWRPLR